MNTNKNGAFEHAPNTGANNNTGAPNTMVNDITNRNGTRRNMNANIAQSTKS